MKKVFSIRCLVFALFLLCGFSLFAQENSSSGTDALHAVAPVVGIFIAQFAAEHPWLLTFLALVGFLRVVFKPIMLGLEAYVKNTPGTEDDQKLAAVEASKAFKFFAFFLDWFGSIKPTVVKQAAKTETK